ncbi:serine protease [Lactococcus ileimucosae]|uniref:serine protease n=1 Tax=Lactococcus ileimucosae TaxID=2941329 RepID=UPI00351549E9
MKFTKKYWIVAGIACLILAGGSASLVAHHQAQVKAEKTAQEAKRTYDKLLSSAKHETEKAETFKVEEDVKIAKEAIKKLKEKDQKDFSTRVEKVRKNWNLYHQADKAVSVAEKSKTEQTVKTAQETLNTLKDEMTKSKKAELQKRLDKVKAELKAKKAKEEAQAKAQREQSQTEASVHAKDKTPDPSAQAEAPATGTGSEYSQAQAPATPSYTAPAAGGGGGAVVPTQPSANTGNPAYNSGGGANANPNVSIEEGNKWIEESNAQVGGFESANGGR